MWILVRCFDTIVGMTQWVEIQGSSHAEELGGAGGITPACPHTLSGTGVVTLSGRQQRSTIKAAVTQHTTRRLPLGIAPLPIDPLSWLNDSVCATGVCVVSDISPVRFPPRHKGVSDITNIILVQAGPPSW